MKLPSGALGSAAGVDPRAATTDKSLKFGLIETLRQAWQDEDIRKRLLLVFLMFVVYTLGIHVPVPIPGVGPADMAKLLENNNFIQLLNTFGGGAFKKVSIFALGLGPYITASIIIQVMSQGYPKWKLEMKEGGEYARKQQNKRTRALTLVLCLAQGMGLIQILRQGVGATNIDMLTSLGIVIFWTAGSMFLLWMGEQITEKGIGNGVSLLIFAGIVISMPGIVSLIASSLETGALQWWVLLMIFVLFLASTWFIVMFTVAQRRIPIQHMRRNFGTKSMGGQTSYLPISVNMAGVIPVIFAIALIYMPAQFANMFPPNSGPHAFLMQIESFFRPDFTRWQGYIGAVFYMGLIFAFTYFWNAMMYNVEDIADNLKRGGSYIPGVRPGKQTTEFLNGVISRVTFVGALFLSVVALSQYVFPALSNMPMLGLVGGTSLLIMVSVALETMRQIEANLLVKQYGG